MAGRLCLHRRGSLLPPVGQPETGSSGRVVSAPSPAIADVSNQSPLLILDASFNPPTVAHAALLTMALARDKSQFHVLLLLSTHNADKGHLTTSHITHRLNMLHLLPFPAAAIATTIDCPRFVDKAHVIANAWPTIPWYYWIMGSDTVERVFDPRYYKDMKSEMSLFFGALKSRILWARRGKRDETDLQIPHDFRRFVEEIHVPASMGKEVMSMSSTEARSTGRGMHPAVVEYVAMHALYATQHGSG